MSLSQLLFSSDGRVSRLPYVISIITFNLIFSFAMLLDGALGTDLGGGLGLISIVTLLIIAAPAIKITIKRCHDRDRSSWFIALSVIPILNLWYFFELAFLKGTTGPNQYGPDPLSSRRGKYKSSPGEYRYDYGPYTNTDIDGFGSDDYRKQRDDTEAYLESLQKKSSWKGVLGISIGEIVALGILMMVICVLGGLVGMNYLNTDTPTTLALAQPTVTPAPTVTPTPTSTPFVKSTPIPGWSRFEFANGKAEIWLPSTYQGGDTLYNKDIVDMTIDTFVTDELFSDMFKEMIDEPYMVFFAFDTEPAEFIPSMYVGRELISQDETFDLDYYLDSVVENLIDDQDGTQIVDRYHTSLDYYSEVGVLIAEDYYPDDQGVTKTIKTTVHVIRIDFQIWLIVSLMGGTDFHENFSAIENSARSFYWEP